MTRPSEMSTKDFRIHIVAASAKPLGWAVLPGTQDRAAARVTVLCADDEDTVWVRHPGYSGPGLELVARAELTCFVAHKPKGRR